jgi:hypothetical protein
MLWNMPLGGSKRTRKGVTLNGTHQLLTYTDDVNIVVVNIDTIQKKSALIIYPSKEAGLEVNPEKTKYMMSHYQKARQV